MRWMNRKILNRAGGVGNEGTEMVLYQDNSIATLIFLKKQACRCLPDRSYFVQTMVLTILLS
jgi:hypothetical protein